MLTNGLALSLKRGGIRKSRGHFSVLETPSLSRVLDGAVELLKPSSQLTGGDTGLSGLCPLNAPVNRQIEVSSVAHSLAPPKQKELN